MLSGYDPCHVLDELLTNISQHHIFLATLIQQKEATYFSDSWCHMPFIPSLPSLKLFQNVTVDGFNVNRMQWNKDFIILLWYSCRQACYNIIDAGSCDLHVVLQWEYILFTLLLDLHTPISFEIIPPLKYYFSRWIPLIPEKIITWR